MSSTANNVSPLLVSFEDSVSCGIINSFFLKLMANVIFNAQMSQMSFVMHCCCVSKQMLRKKSACDYLCWQCSPLLTAPKHKQSLLVHVFGLDALWLQTHVTLHVLNCDHMYVGAGAGVLHHAGLSQWHACHLRAPGWALRTSQPRSASCASCTLYTHTMQNRSR